eukprot:CAMPEP_0197937654 /NCGR_PEP_ID=MMETSP1439-20131203/116862_1 /TAXON_ID=66791 /ORGANISM="Gonyaulax spinifera, Strain CCMP409" /LENGTH=291 /DNA_ID=CAMNT_0043560685 /DNA_START=42 /DNA_END=913 /DNA_ORIENTATION=+
MGRSLLSLACIAAWLGPASSQCWEGAPRTLNNTSSPGASTVSGTHLCASPCASPQRRLKIPHPWSSRPASRQLRHELADASGLVQLQSVAWHRTEAQFSPVGPQGPENEAQKQPTAEVGGGASEEVMKLDVFSPVWSGEPDRGSRPRGAGVTAGLDSVGMRASSASSSECTSLHCVLLARLRFPRVRGTASSSLMQVAALVWHSSVGMAVLLTLMITVVAVMLLVASATFIHQLVHGQNHPPLHPKEEPQGMPAARQPPVGGKESLMPTQRCSLPRGVSSDTYNSLHGSTR